MNCPSELSGVLLHILRTGVLRIRSLGWSGNAAQCAREADHIHNLPDLLDRYSVDRLKFYWDVERISFIKQSAGADLAMFEPLWSELGRQVSLIDSRVVV